MDVIRISAERLWIGLERSGCEWSFAQVAQVAQVASLQLRTGMFGLPGGLTTDAC